MASTDPNNTAAANATKNKAAANTSDTKTVAEGISSSPSSPSSLCGDSSTPKPESDSGSMDVSFGSSPAPSFLKFCRRRSLPGAIDVCACARARHPASSLTSGCFWELALAQLHLLQVLAVCGGRRLLHRLRLLRRLRPRQVRRLHHGVDLRPRLVRDLHEGMKEGGME